MKIKYFGMAILIALTGCDEPKPLSQTPRPVLVYTVAEKATPKPMVLVGEVRPRYESNQGFRLDGKIIERKVEVGSFVKKGQLLARLDAADTQLNTSAAFANVQAAEADFALAQAELNRQQQLFNKHFISASALDVREAQLKTAAAKLAQTKAQANVLANQTQYTHLTADRDGVVTMIHAEPGQVVKIGDIVAKVADTHALEVLVAVPESQIPKVMVQQEVSLRLWAARQNVYSGTVREISPAAESTTRTFDVRVTINEPDNTVKLGMTAEVKFPQSDNPQNAQFLIPSNALTQIDGQKVVWVIDNEKAQPRAVVAGLYREDGVLIENGLNQGDKIAIAGVHTLIKDQVVKPVTGVTP